MRYPFTQVQPGLNITGLRRCSTTPRTLSYSPTRERRRFAVGTRGMRNGSDFSPSATTDSSNVSSTRQTLQLFSRVRTISGPGFGVENPRSYDFLISSKFDYSILMSFNFISRFIISNTYIHFIFQAFFVRFYEFSHHLQYEVLVT